MTREVVRDMSRCRSRGGGHEGKGKEKKGKDKSKDKTKSKKDQAGTVADAGARQRSNSAAAAYTQAPDGTWIPRSMHNNAPEGWSACKFYPKGECTKGANCHWVHVNNDNTIEKIAASAKIRYRAKCAVAKRSASVPLKAPKAAAAATTAQTAGQDGG